MKKFLSLFTLLLVLCMLFSSCVGDIGGIIDGIGDIAIGGGATEPPRNENAVSVDDVPEFSGYPYVTINENQPTFTEDELITDEYEFYSELDSLGRCGYTMACIGVKLMPTEERGNIGQVKPSGWQTVKYDIVDGKYLYNRCHLIGFQLTGENANTKNLITGTRFMNADGMLPFENMVADYIKETENHVIYRVTPIFKGDNLVASGVQMEAYSVEDEGDGICFNVYVYNNQPGVTIEYATGHSWLSTDPPRVTTTVPKTAAPTTPDTPDDKTVTYVLNTNTKKFHEPTCSSAKSMSASSKKEYVGDRDALISDGYSPCGVCKP